MKKMQIVLVVILMLVMTACEKESGTAINLPKEIEVNPIEDTSDTVNTDDETETGKDSAEEPSDDEMTESQTPENQIPETKNNQMKELDMKPEKESSQTEEQKPAQQEPAQQSVSAATITGTVLSVGDGTFVIRKADIISSEVMVSREDSEEVSVVYTDSTEFVLCSSSDGGITTDYSAATSGNLSNEKLVELQGAYEGNDFIAQKIKIYNFN